MVGQKRKSNNVRSTTGKKAAKKRAVTKKAAPKKRAPKKSAHATAMNKHKVLWNPFGMHRDAKLHDGACVESHGRQFRSVKPVALTLAPFSYDFHLFAGLGMNATTSLKGDSATDASLTQFNYGSKGFGSANLQVIPGAGNTVNRRVTYSGTVSKWRMLSVGMKLSLLNNDDDNEGWFEVIRTNRRVTDDDIQMIDTNDEDIPIGPGSDVYTLLNPDRMADGIEFANDASYIAGPLKDLKNHQFVLRKTDDEHNFIALQDVYTVNATIDPLGNRTADINFATALTTEVHRHFIDPSFDQLTVRIHGRNAGGGGASTTVLVETVSNMEIIYDDGTELAQFMTPNNAMQGVETVVRATNTI